MKVILDTTEGDFADIKRLADLQFGPGYVDHDQILNVEISIHIKENDKIASYGTAGIGFPKELGCSDQLDHYDKCGLIFQIVTDPVYCGKGFGTLIAKELLKRLQKLGCRTVMGAGWKTSKGVLNIEKMFSSLGFKVVKEIPDFWKKCSGVCVECKTKDCFCSAVIYEFKF